MKKVLLGMWILLLVLIIPNICPATTVTLGQKSVELVGISEDWTWTEDFKYLPRSESLRIQCIIFQPGATGSRVSIRDADSNGPRIFPNLPALNTSDVQVIYYDGIKLRPFVDYSDSVVVGSTLTIILKE